MISFRADPDVCPDCGELHGGGAACAHCQLPLHGPQAVELWLVTQRLQPLLYQRAALLTGLRTTAATTQPAATHAAYEYSSVYAAPVPTYPPAAREQWPAPTPRPKAEWSQRRVQNTLLTLGVLLLAIAALIFTVVTWGTLGIVPRAGILLTVTAAAAVGAPALLARRLEATAEAVATLAVALVVIDSQAARQSVHALQRVDGRVFWAVATAGIAALCAAYSSVVGLEMPRLSAAVAAQLPGLLLAMRLEDRAGASVVLLAQTAISAYAASVWQRPRIVTCLAGAATLTGAGGALLALAAAFGSDATDFGSALPGAVALVAVGATSWWVGWLLRRVAGAVLISSAGAAFAVTAVVLAATRLTMDAASLPAVVGLCALGSVALSLALRRPWRDGLAAAGSALTVVALAAEAESVIAALLGPLGWLNRSWFVSEATVRARTVLSPEMPWHGSPPVLVTVAAGTVTAALLALSYGRKIVWKAAFVPALAAALVITPLALDWPYAAAIGWELTFVVAAVALAIRTTAGHPGVARVAAIAGGGLLVVHAVPWSLANEQTTHAALVLAVVASAVTATMRPAFRAPASAIATAALLGWVFALTRSGGASLQVSAFVLALAATVLLAATAANAHRAWVSAGDLVAVEVVAAGAYPFIVSLTFYEPAWAAFSLLAGAVAAAAVATRRDRMDAGAVAAGLTVGWAWAGATAVGASIPGAGLAVVLVACACAGVAWPLRHRHGEVIEVVAAAAYLIGLTATMSDVPLLSWALVAGGLTCFSVSIRPDRRGVAYAGWVLLTLLLWRRLAEADVTVPEPYLLPPAALTLAIGYLRRRALPSLSSWAAYGTGLTLALEPTLFMTLTDPGLTRPLLLCAGALAVVLVGARARLRAPLVLGGVTLAVDAIVQVAPLAAALPRWVSFATVGITLLLVGATYEQRLRDVRKLQERINALG